MTLLLLQAELLREQSRKWIFLPVLPANFWHYKLTPDNEASPGHLY